MSARFIAARAWTQAEDRLFPALGLGPPARAIYYHLLRATLLAGKPEVRRTTRELARATAQSTTTVRVHLRRLERAGCVRVAARTRVGLTISVRAPEEILRRGMIYHAPTEETPPQNSLKDPALRQKIFRREHGRCFYCLRSLDPRDWTLDHVVPRAAGGSDAPHNLVACCHECNIWKHQSRAEDFLRKLYRRRRLTAAELDARLRALRRLTRKGLSSRV